MKLNDYSKDNMSEEKEHKNDECAGKCENCQCEKEGGCQKGDACCKKEGSAESAAEQADCPKCAEYKSGWQRALADYENLKRDMVKNAADSRNRIKADFAEQLLPVMDNFDQAVTHAPQLDDAKLNNWLQGVTFIKQQFAQVFTEMGLEEITATGHFDPHLHDVVEERESEQEAGEILEVVSAGWKIGEMVIRPAKVIVSK